MWYQYFIFAFIGIVLFVLASYASNGAFRYYQRLVESIILRNKIESILGINILKVPEDGLSFPGERLVNERYVKSWQDKSSQEFQKEVSHGGAQGICENVFRAFQAAGVLLFLYSIIMILVLFLNG